MIGIAIRQQSGNNNVIGGAAAADRNLISGDQQGGISVENGDGTNAVETCESTLGGGSGRHEGFTVSEAAARRQSLRLLRRVGEWTRLEEFTEEGRRPPLVRAVNSRLSPHLHSIADDCAKVACGQFLPVATEYLDLVVTG